MTITDNANLIATLLGGWDEVERVYNTKVLSSQAQPARVTLKEFDGGDIDQIIFQLMEDGTVGVFYKKFDLSHVVVPEVKRAHLSKVVRKLTGKDQ